MIDTLFSDVNISTSKKEDIQLNTEQFFINFINQLEGWKTKCKNLHLSAPQMGGDNIHTRLDEYLEILSEFQDSIAEDYQATLGDMNPNAMKGIPCDSLNALDFIREVMIKTKEFYNKIPQEVDYVGIKSETETFIHNTKKYTYLFRKCNVKPY